MKIKIVFLFCFAILFSLLIQGFTNSEIKSPTTKFELKEENTSLKLPDGTDAMMMTHSKTGTGSSQSSAYSNAYSLALSFTVATYYCDEDIPAGPGCDYPSPLSVGVTSVRYRYDRRIGWLCTLTFSPFCSSDPCK